MHTSSKSCEVISHTSLCLNLKKPPFLQDRACVTSNDVPYIELEFYQVASYIWSLILMASQNSCFANSYPSSLMGKFVNQYETRLIKSFHYSFCFFSWCYRDCRNFSWFLFLRSTLISSLVLLSFLLVPRIWAWKFEVILVQSLYSFSAVSTNIFMLNPIQDRHFWGCSRMGGGHFFTEISKFCYIKKYRYRLHFST